MGKEGKGREDQEENEMEVRFVGVSGQYGVFWMTKARHKCCGRRRRRKSKLRCVASSDAF